MVPKIPENFNFPVLNNDITMALYIQRVPENKNILSKLPEIRKFPEKWHLWSDPKTKFSLGESGGQILDLVKHLYRPRNFCLTKELIASKDFICDTFHSHTKSPPKSKLGGICLICIKSKW